MSQAIDVPSARTTLGDVPASSLGTVNYHEHIFQVTPLLPGDELDDEEASRQEAEFLRSSGFSTMIDATPVGLGRRPTALARISETTGLRVIATTGVHREEHYGAGHRVREATEQELADAFISDIRRGMHVDDADPAGPRTGVCAGMIKAGIGYWRVSRFERRGLAAVGAAHRDTGAPVMVHLEHGSAAHEVLEILEAEGTPSTAVVLAHIDRNPDPHLHAELAARGAYLGYDGFARHRDRPDSDLIACLLAAAESGAEDRLVIGGDVARKSRYRAYGGMPGLAYLGTRVVPRLVARAGERIVRKVLVENPARLLARF